MNPHIRFSTSKKRTFSLFVVGKMHFASESYDKLMEEIGIDGPKGPTECI